MLTPFSRLLRRKPNSPDAEPIGEDRREYKRAAVEFAVTVLIDGSRLSAGLADVSISGAKLLLEPKLAVGASVTLYLDRLAMPVAATVMRHTSSGMGIRFDDPGLGVLVAGWARGMSGARSEESGS